MRWDRGSSLFAASIFLGAFLIFLVQPMVGKRILPWFGGGPGVWTVCLMFYQCTLFLGYAYAHGLVSWIRPAYQWRIHGLVLVGALLLLPVLPGEAWKPDPQADPSQSILWMLVVNVALPFIALAATGPLLQAWFSRAYPGRSPYPLYAVSNVGSLAALLVFPTLIEPLWSLETTGELWAWVFAVTAVAILGCGLVSLRPEKPAGAEDGSEASDPGARIGARVVSLWLLLPACGVILLMAVTNKLCLDVASVPFLWVLPLGLYLVSFILTFGPQRLYRRSVYLSIGVAALLLQLAGKSPLIALLPGLGVLGDVPAQATFYLVLLFATCMLVHGELYVLRPPPRQLTSFYLAVSLGGALGGLFVGLIAPSIFDDYHELLVGLGVSFGLLLWIFGRDPKSWLYFKGPRWHLALASGGVVGLLASVTLLGSIENSTALYSERTFFGVIRVLDVGLGSAQPGTQVKESEPKLRILAHGTTLHGAQLLHGPGRKRPVSYYGLATGIGLIMAQRTPGVAHDVGVIGLGAGALAAYGREGDRFRFYEIDPGVIRVAREEGYFSFLSDSEAEVEVVLGDARLSLQGESQADPEPQFDILVVDAFSSDSVPVHLLTREAIELYARSVKDGGLIAFHASNRILDLSPILYRIGLELDLHMLSIENGLIPFEMGQPARWIFLSRDEERIQELSRIGPVRVRSLGVQPRLVRFLTPPRTRFADTALWTDNYSSLLALIRKGSGGG